MPQAASWSWQSPRFNEHTRRGWGPISISTICRWVAVQYYESSLVNKLDETLTYAVQCSVWLASTLKIIEGALYDSHSAASLAQHVSLSRLSPKGNCVHMWLILISYRYVWCEGGFLWQPFSNVSQGPSKVLQQHWFLRDLQMVKWSLCDSWLTCIFCIMLMSVFPQTLLQRIPVL